MGTAEQIAFSRTPVSYPPPMKLNANLKIVKDLKMQMHTFSEGPATRAGSCPPPFLLGMPTPITCRTLMLKQLQPLFPALR
eukprot:1160126-Pelagomonas_calceolata.AAC.1